MDYQKKYLNNKTVIINNLILSARNNILQQIDYQSNYLLKDIYIKKKYKKINKFKRFNYKYKKILSYMNYPFFHNYNINLHIHE
jgi:hypothetical protein